MKPLYQALLLLLMLSTAWGAGATDENRLIMVGLNLFPNIVSVDQDIADKRTDDGNVYLVIAYENQSVRATRLAETLRKQVSTIKRYSSKVAVVKASELSSFPKRVAGIFLADEIGLALLNQVIGHAAKHGTLLFSPIPGDVERGVTMGMQITSKIWPYCNTKTMKQSNIRFHPSFLKIMRCYDE
ncbi:hypothetical protein ACFL48_01960 [Pseudomonadota bacterium]